MATTGFRKATSIIAISPEGSVTNTDCLLIDSTVNDAAAFGAGNDSSITLDFNSFGIPPGSTIESINIKFQAQHFNIGIAHLLLTALLLIDNNDITNISNSVGGPSQIAFPNNTDAITTEQSINLLSFGNNDLVNGLAGGLTRIRVTFNFNNLTGVSFPDSTGGTVALFGFNQVQGDLATPSIEIVFTRPPSKVKLKGIPPTTAQLIGFSNNSGIIPTPQIGVDSGNIGIIGVRDILAADNPGVVVVTQQNDVANSDLFGGKIGFQLSTLITNTGAVSPSSIMDVSDINSITANVLFKFNTDTSDGSNSFTTGFGGFVTQASSISIDFGEQVVSNNSSNESNVTLHSNILSGATLANNIDAFQGNLVFLSFNILYTDDTPSSQSVNFYGQTSAGELGLGGSINNTPSVEFIFDYNVGGSNRKVKIQQQPDIFDGDLIEQGSHTKIKIG